MKAPFKQLCYFSDDNIVNVSVVDLVIPDPIVQYIMFNVSNVLFNLRFKTFKPIEKYLEKKVYNLHPTDEREPG